LLLLAVVGRTDKEDPWMQTAGYSALAVFGASLVALAATARAGEVLHRLLTAPTLRAFGKYSYAIYLFHMPVCAVLREVVRAPGSFPTLLGSQLPGQLLFYLVTTSLVFGAAWLSWRAFESPILALKRYFPARSPGRMRQVPAGTWVDAPAAEAVEADASVTARGGDEAGNDSGGLLAGRCGPA
jgi:peptidoglycan/LPS O-acetylase OafA/YrhL